MRLVVKVYSESAVWPTRQRKFSLFGQHPDKAAVRFGEAQHPTVAPEEAAADCTAQQPVGKMTATFKTCLSPKVVFG